MYLHHRLQTLISTHVTMLTNLGFRVSSHVSLMVSKIIYLLLTWLYLLLLCLFIVWFKCASFRGWQGTTLAISKHITQNHHNWLVCCFVLLLCVQRQQWNMWQSHVKHSLSKDLWIEFCQWQLYVLGQVNVRWHTVMMMLKITLLFDSY